jgi:hypothetical protein
LRIGRGVVNEDETVSGSTQDSEEDSDASNPDEELEAVRDRLERSDFDLLLRQHLLHRCRLVLERLMLKQAWVSRSTHGKYGGVFVRHETTPMLLGPEGLLEGFPVLPYSRDVVNPIVQNQAENCD